MRRRAVISLTPLIDVVFILLVFFMLASSFMDWRTLELNVTRGGGAGDMQGALLVDVRSDGLRLAGQSISIEELAANLRKQFASDPERKVLVKPGVEVPLQRAVDLIDAIAAAGGRNVSLIDAKGR